jgi:hypothetical protein
VLELGATIWDAAWRAKGRNDLARMDRVVEDRGAYEDWAYAVRVHASGWSDLIGELGVRTQRDAEPRWRGEVLWRRLVMLLPVHASVVVVETPFAAVFSVTAVETAGGGKRLRELMLGRSVGAVVRGWVREVWVDSRGAEVVDGSSAGGVAEGPGVFVRRLLHGASGGRGGRASCGTDIPGWRHRP